MYRISIESSASHQRHRPSGHGTRSFSPTPRFISQTTIWIYCFGRSYYLAFVRVISRASVFFSSISTFRKILRASARSLADLSRAYLDRVCPHTVRASFRELFCLPAKTQIPGKLLSPRMQITFTLLVITGNYFTFGFLRTLLQFQITVKLQVT